MRTDSLGQMLTFRVMRSAATSNRPPVTRLALLAFALATGGCLKTLDESLIDQQRDAGSGGAGGSAGTAGSGGTAGTGGASGASGMGGSSGGGGSSGSGGMAGGAGDAGSDAPVITRVPYDSGTHPVTNVSGTVQLPAVLSADADNVFRTRSGANAVTVLQTAVANGASTPLTADTFDQVGALASPQVSAFVYVAGGLPTTDEGRVSRVPKSGGATSDITLPASTPRATGITAASDGNAYFTTRALTTGAPALLKASLAAGTVTAETLYSSAGNEVGGDLTAVAGCVYWISNGRVYVVGTGGGGRADALTNQITDAVGLASDDDNFYVTRGNGEVWQRPLTGAGCDGSGAVETLVDSGYAGIGDVIAYDSKIAWIAKGDEGNGFDGGGVFETTPGSNIITQIAPADGGPEKLVASATAIVFSTSDGRLRRVPRN